MGDWDGNERRAYTQYQSCPHFEAHLTDEKIAQIAEEAAEMALEKVYTQVGKSIISKVFWLGGVVVLALFTWLSGNGHIK